MLERATRCANYGGRQTCLRTKDAQQSRRLLHAAFWRHGAGDLDHLPSLYLHSITTLFESDATNALGDHKRRPFPILWAPSPLLDLVHPLKTHIKRISCQQHKYWESRFSILGPASTPARSFTSTKIQSQDEFSQTHTSRPTTANPIPSPQISHEAMIQDTSKTSLATYLCELQFYRDYIKKERKISNTADYNRALKMWHGLDDVHRSSDLAYLLIEFHTRPRKNLEAKANARVTLEPILELLQSIPPGNRKGASYFNLSMKFQSAKQFHSAITVAEAALHDLEPQKLIGSVRWLFNLAVSNGMWEYVFELLDDRSDIVSKIATQPMDFAQVIINSKVPQDAAYGSHFRSLFALIEMMPEFLDVGSRRIFLLDWTRVLLVRERFLPPLAAIQVLRFLKNLGSLNSSTYEAGIYQILDGSGQLAFRVKLAAQAYKLHEGLFTPSLRVLRHLLNASARLAEDSSDLAAKPMVMLLEEWQKYYDHPLIKDTAIFMRYFANRGDMERLMQVFSGYIHRHTRERDAQLFTPIMHAHAMRGDPQAVQNWMNTMSNSYGVIPNTYCWNILMHAFQRIDDLDGALSCMSRLLNAGLVPDRYTFGTLASIAADRGLRGLLDKLNVAAARYGIRDDQIMHDCMVLALLNNGMVKDARDYARRLTLRKGPANKRRMWNQILARVCITPASFQSNDNPRLIAQEMRRLGVTYDSTTFAAILRSYTIANRTGQARTILIRLMPKIRMRRTALHYAIVMEGFIAEGNYQSAQQLHADMLNSRINPDVSSNNALLKITAHSARDKALAERADYGVPMVTTDVILELLEELTSPESQPMPSTSPILHQAHFTSAKAHPTIYFDFAVRALGKIKAFDAVKTLVEEHERKFNSTGGLPLRWIASVMRSKYFERDAQEVARYWNLALATAARRTRDSISKGDMQKGTEKSLYPHMFRTILCRPLDIFLDAMNAIGNHREMLDAVNKVFALGFDLDNANWNKYCQLVATGGYHFDAFFLSERYLIGSFTGWSSPRGSLDDKLFNPAPLVKLKKKVEQRPLEPKPFPMTKAMAKHIAKQKAREKLAEEEEMVKPVLKPGIEVNQMHLDYKTAVRLAVSVRNLRRRAPFDRAAQESLVQLQEKAPLTWEAIRTLPLKPPHPTATHVLGAVSSRRGIQRMLPALNE